MRTTLKHTLAALAALGALMLTGTACTQDDPLGGNNPAGTQLLQLGKVTIAGTTTATRSADAATRADADADGFIGIRKTQFVKNDKLVLTLTPPASTDGSAGTPVEVTAKLDGTTWTLPKTYFTPGTTVSATHTPTQMSTSGSSGLTTLDKLVTAQPVELNTNGTPLALTLTHANAMVEVTPPTDIDYKDLTISATRSGAPDAQALSHFTEGTGTNLRHRTIAPAGATLNSVSLKVNDITYTTTLTQVVEANKRYPITLTITGDVLTATVAADTDWDDGGDVNGYPTGYDYYISTAAELEKFRDDVNADATTDGSGARSATAIQTADIDMTGVAWEPIGAAASHTFQGSYNGNGHSIKHLTMGGANISSTKYMGLFAHITGAKITGVHLRDCNLKGKAGTYIYGGALAGYVKSGSIVTLCSATGILEATVASHIYVGGLVGYVDVSTEDYSYFTRCSADVTVTTTPSTSASVGGFAGVALKGHFAGCIALGTVTKNSGNGRTSGFGNGTSSTYNYHAIGCISSGSVTDNNGISTLSPFGDITSIRSCLATQSSYNYFYVANSITATDNVSLGTLTVTRPNATPSTRPADAYDFLTANNAASPIKIKTLHYSPTDGYTTDVVERYWFAKGIWKDNGTDLPTIDMSYEGTINPEPIQTGNNVYPVNGYWVTAPDTDELKQYQWNANLGATSMLFNPCYTTDAANKGWKAPYMKDIQNMAGWATIHPWSQSSDATTRKPVNAEFLTAFPAGAMYWSYTICAAPSTALNCTWAIAVESNNQARYTWQGKESENRIRCVQKQKAIP